MGNYLLRCHSQKLRCPKEQGVATCTRCLKAGARCVFSPAGSAARRVAPAVTTPVYDDAFSFQTPVDDSLGIQFDWQPLDFGSTLTPPLEAAAGAGTQDAVQLEPAVEKQGVSSSSPLENRRSSCVRQLTALAADLDEVFREMPTASLFHMPRGSPIEEVLGHYTKTFDPQRLLELLFRSGQVLIDIYPDILGILFDTETQVNACPNSDCIHIADLNVSSEDIPGSGDMFDTFLFNLLVLCHTRMLDIFESLLSHATLCAKISTAYPDGKEARVSVPELRVGNFVASAASSSTMQAVLLAHIASVLKTQSQQLSRKVSEAIGDEPNDKQNRMLRLQCEILEDSSADRVKQLQEVKERLIALGFPI